MSQGCDMSKEIGGEVEVQTTVSSILEDQGKNEGVGEQELTTLEPSKACKEKVEGKQATCLVCFQSLVSNTLGVEGAPTLNLLDFCNLVKVSVPPRSKLSLQGLETPLCTKCLETVIHIRSILSQIDELERSLIEARAVVKEQVVASYNNENCDDVEDARAAGEVHSLVNSIRSNIKKDISERSSKVVSKLESVSSRKKPGRKPGKKIGNTPEEESGSKGKSPEQVESVSHRSSFGRVVKRPRYFMMSDEESGAEMEETVEKKFDPNQTKPNAVPGLIALSAQSVKVEQASSSSSSSSTPVETVTSVNIEKDKIEENDSEQVTQEIISKAESSFELEKICEVEFHADSSDTNWSEAEVSDDELKKSPSKGTKRKKKSLKKIKPTQKVRVKLIGVNGEELGRSIIRDGKVVIDNEFHKKLVDGEAVITVDKEIMGMRVKCDKCTRTFTDAKKRERHVRRVHEGKQDYECKQCEKPFEKLKDLVQHRKADHPPKEPPKLDDAGRRSFECEFCKIVFRNHSDLLIHRRRHTGERPFKCESCSEGFISKGRYEVHVEVSHPEVPPLKCEFCPRSFFRHHRLRDHKKSHTGERPYLCEICSKSFSQPAYLKYHQTKHKELNLDEFKCDECDKKFASPVNLKFHKETQHQKKYRYHCDVCGHGATHMSHLKLHMRSHTGERPHSCPYCGKSFSRGSQLKIHIRSHTGERPYICNTCTKSFTNSSKLRRHELTHLSNKSKKKQNIVKVTSLSSGSQAQTPSTTQEIKFVPEIVTIEEDNENDEAVLKLEQLPAGQEGEHEVQQQLITIEQGNGVTYQVIATNDAMNIGENYTEYIVLNGDFEIA